MPAIGSQIKPFTAQAFREGRDFFEVSDADLRGKWSVVFFYPADFTFVCPTELEDLAENHETFQKLGVEIFSVSTDKHFTHKAWHDTSPAIGKVKYTMIGDPAGVIARNFDALMEDGSHVAERATFLIDPEGAIQYIETTSGGVGRSASELLDKVRAAQYVAAHPGEVCPAKWKEDGSTATLSPSLDLIGKI